MSLPVCSCWVKKHNPRALGKKILNHCRKTISFALFLTPMPIKNEITVKKTGEPMPQTQNANVAIQLQALAQTANENYKAKKFDAASKLCQDILALDPQQHSAMAMLGMIKAQAGDHASAIEFYQKAIAANPNKAETYKSLAESLYFQGNREQARRFYAQALILQPGNPLLFHNHGFISYEMGDLANAIESLEKAVFYAPDNASYKKAYVLAVTDANYKTYKDIAKTVLIACLEEDTLFHQALMPALQSLFHFDPVQAPVHALYNAKDIKKIDMKSLKAPLQESFLLKALQRGLMTHTSIENALTRLRQFFLHQIAENKINKDDLEIFIPFLASLSEQCWHNEYLYEVSAAEEKALQSLQDKLKQSFDANNVQSICTLLITSCYMPMHQLPNAKEISTQIRKNGNAALIRITELQIDEPLEEQKIRGSIGAFGTISNDVSQKVRDQYESNPYPRWKTVDLHEKGADYSGQDVLVAGCGTGREIAITVTEWKGANVLGTDLSLSSLSYADRQLKKVGLEGKYELLHGDILELEKLGRKFDQITCSGVLHHMEDPIAGWKVLQNILKPGGRMKIALYSKAARESVRLCRDYIAEKGYAATTEDIKKFRKDIASLPADHPILGCRQWRDFFNLSECRDLLFHVQEHQFTLPQIKKILNDLNMEIVGFCMQTNKRILKYKQLFPDEPTCLNLDNWHLMEQQNPRLFADMYQFLVVNKE